MMLPNDRHRYSHTPTLPYSHTFLLLLLAVGLVAGSVRADLSAKQIVTKAGANYGLVNDYTVDAKLSVESPQMHVPEMLVRIFFKKPNKLHVDSRDGFAMLPRQGAIVGNPLKDMLSISDFSAVRSQRVLGDDCYVVTGTVQKEDRSTETTVWIDKKNFLVRQMATNPEWGPSISAKLWYTRVGARYWLPSRTSAKISIPPLPDEKFDAKKPPGGPTIVTLVFSNYRVNTGLSDQIFKKQEGGK